MSSRQGLLGQIDAIGAEAFHILLVEDDELTLKVTEGLLRHCDYQGVVSGFLWSGRNVHKLDFC